MIPAISFTETKRRPKGPLQRELTVSGVRLRTSAAQATVLFRISAAALIEFFAPQLQRLIEGGANFKIAP